MQNKKYIEISVGLLMVLAVLAFLFMALKVSGLTSTTGFFNPSYKLIANFTDVGGLKVRSPVSIAGVQIGTVDEIQIDPKTFEAIVTMKINQSVADLPVDTSASITASGILGDNYIALSPGFSSSYLKNGAHIATTYAATSWQSLISTFISGGKKQ